MIPGWYVACRSDRLRRVPYAMTIWGQPLVLFRDARGRIGCLEDRCPHRGVQLSKGKVREDGVECPYHGWRFGHGGDCVAIPSLADAEASLHRYDVRSYPVCEKQGFVWVYVGGEEPRGEPFHLPHLGEGGWRHVVVRSSLRASLASVIENIIDCTHTGYIHGGLFRSPASHSVDAVVESDARHVSIVLDEKGTSESLLSKLFVREGRPVEHVDSFFMPSIVQVHYRFGPGREILGIHFCTPVTERLTIDHVNLIWTMAPVTSLLAPLMPVAARIVMRQDIWILENQARQLQRFGERFMSVPADAGVNRIRTLLRRGRIDGHSSDGGHDSSIFRRIRVSFRL